ncbi:uncharacterized protein F5147DRAFT_661921 [Suillus discolor]|uniref:Uncharacterized protein n=1 Tax=Suillus discolor TaxID=1912936 RepID=A0A9P7FJ54_9AGAM|nr:uncharacterized protein F5147DRAFT_661921 [Suillus discolor]KAG2120398.1 hypothetical protein F5147DRAFT_661921 [Suillus discolor]
MCLVASRPICPQPPILWNGLCGGLTARWYQYISPTQLVSRSIIQMKLTYTFSAMCSRQQSRACISHFSGHIWERYDRCDKITAVIYFRVPQTDMGKINCHLDYRYTSKISNSFTSLIRPLVGFTPRVYGSNKYKLQGIPQIPTYNLIYYPF